MTLTIWDATDPYRYVDSGTPYPSEVESERAILAITLEKVHRRGM